MTELRAAGGFVIIDSRIHSAWNLKRQCDTVNVEKDWASAVRSDIFHYFAGEDTESSRLFIAKSFL